MSYKVCAVDTAFVLNKPRISPGKVYRPETVGLSCEGFLPQVAIITSPKLHDMSQVLCLPFSIHSRVFKMLKEENHQATKKSSLILEKLHSLKQEDETLYNILAIDVWALAKTMDEFQPGFWSAFMKNREKALKRFIAETMKNKPTDSKRPPFLR